MHKIRRLLIIIGVTAIALFALSACSKDEDYKEILTKAQEKSNEVKSISYTYEVITELSIMDRTSQTISISTIDQTMEPLGAYVVVLQKGGTKDIETHVYMKEEDSYVSIDGGDSWLRDSGLQEGAMIEAVNEDAYTWLDLFEMTGKMKKEELGNGRKAMLFEGKIDGKKYAKFVSNDSGEDLKDNKYGDIIAKIWIEEETYMPLQYELDMTGYMQVDLESNKEESDENSLKTNKYIMKMTILDYNHLSEIKVPINLAKKEAGVENANDTANTILRKAYETMENANSLSYNMNINMTVGILGTNSTTKIESECIYIRDPFYMYINMDMLEDGINVEIYAEEVDGAIRNYSKYKDDSEWVETEEDVTKLYRKETLDAYLGNTLFFADRGIEVEIDGKNAIMYEGKLSGAQHNRMLVEGLVMNNIAEMYALTEEELEAVYNELDEAIVRAWFEEDTSNILKYEIDMTKTMEAILNNISLNKNTGEGFKLEVEELSVEFIITGYNNVEGPKIEP